VYSALALGTEGATLDGFEESDGAEGLFCALHPTASKTAAHKSAVNETFLFVKGLTLSFVIGELLSISHDAIGTAFVASFYAFASTQCCGVSFFMHANDF
jgi:hypothetical protein